MDPVDRPAHAHFTASIPENYDRYLGPVLFDPFAREMARRVGALAPKRVLETACGTGIVTRRLLGTLPGDTQIVASDLNGPMVDYAKASTPADARVEWRAADMCDLGDPDGSYDAVVCQFGLMFVPDKGAAFREARRVLGPGGTYHINVWDSRERNPFAKAAHEIICSFFHEDPPTFYQTPFGMHDRHQVREMLAAGGFGSIQDEVISLESTSRSAEELARGLVEGNPVIQEIQSRGGVDAAEIIEALSTRLRPELGDGPVRVPLQAIFFKAQAA